MRILLFTDTHFGIKHNSLQFWEAQRRFLEKQIIKDLTANPGTLIVCLGDVFDSRAFLNTYIMSEVQTTFKKIAELSSNFVIVAGNHDFYSPEDDKTCALEQIFENLHPNIQLVVRKPLILEEKKMMFVPWYCALDLQKWIDIAEQKNLMIFTHTDIVTTQVKSRIPILSGHIHTPNTTNNLFNLGSCYPLSMADANQERYYYSMDWGENGSADIRTLTRIANTSSMRFWRFNSVEKLSDISEDDYVELFISSQKLSNHAFREQLRELRNKFKNLKILFADVNKNLGEISATSRGYDMDFLIDSMVPETLHEALNVVKKKIKEI